MKAKEWIFIVVVGAGLLALFHAIYLYFWVYGDVIHSHLTPKQWLSMYGINTVLVFLASCCIEIARSK